MAEDSDKTEEPTDHKLQEGRKKGQVFKSQEIVSTLLLLATAGMLGLVGSWMFWSIGDYAKYIYTLIPRPDILSRNHFLDGLYLLWVFFKVLVPLLAAAFIMAILGNIAQIKWLFSTEPMKPKMSKISPVEGFKRIFSFRSLMELAKQVVKLLVIGWVSYKVVYNDIWTLTLSVNWNLYQTCHFLKNLCTRIIFYVVLAMGAISIIDYIFQRKQFMKQMKMSIQELKDEYKDTEGNPQVKAKIRQLMRQGAMARMMEDVPKSQAVVTNPTHLAVALRYIQGQDQAPVVVAKGERLIAVQIKVIAEEHDVPIVENVEMAKALFKACEVGQTIPPELYKAVAEVLAYIFKLKKKRQMMRRKRRQVIYGARAV